MRYVRLICFSVLAFALSARAQSNLVVSNDGGASNLTATAVTLGMNVKGTNAPPLVHTNFFGWGTADQGTNLPLWQHTSTNLVAFGLAQTNLTGLATQTQFYYRSFSKDASNGLVWASASIGFKTLVGTVVSNGVAGSTNIVVAVGPNNIGTLTINGSVVNGGTSSGGSGTTNLITVLATGPNAGSAGGAVISNLGTPSAGTDAANKGYADTAVAGATTIANSASTSASAATTIANTASTSAAAAQTVANLAASLASNGWKVVNAASWGITYNNGSWQETNINRMIASAGNYTRIVFSNPGTNAGPAILTLGTNTLNGFSSTLPLLAASVLITNSNIEIDLDGVKVQPQGVVPPSGATWGWITLAGATNVTIVMTAGASIQGPSVISATTQNSLIFGAGARSKNIAILGGFVGNIGGWGMLGGGGFNQDGSTSGIDGLTIAYSVWTNFQGGPFSDGGPLFLGPSDNVLLFRDTFKSGTYQGIEFGAGPITGHNLKIQDCDIGDFVWQSLRWVQIGNSSNGWDHTLVDGNNFVQNITNSVNGYVQLGSGSTYVTNGITLPLIPLPDFTFTHNSVTKTSIGGTNVSEGSPIGIVVSGVSFTQGATIKDNFVNSNFAGNTNSGHGFGSTGILVMGAPYTGARILLENDRVTSNSYIGVDFFNATNCFYLFSEAIANGTDVWAESSSFNITKIGVTNNIQVGTFNGLAIGGDVSSTTAFMNIGNLKLTPLYVTSSNQFPALASLYSNTFYDVNTSAIGVGIYTNTFPSINTILRGALLGYRNSGTNLLMLNANSGKTFDGLTQFILIPSNSVWFGECVTNNGACYTTFTMPGITTNLPILTGTSSLTAVGSTMFITNGVAKAITTP